MRPLVPLACLALTVSILPAQGLPRLPGLRLPVVLERDAHGVPHVTGLCRHDVWLVQGWVQASDRLFQMDLLRRQGSGTLAELLGPDALGSDVQLRTLGVRRAAERSLAVLSPRTREALQAFAAGVNGWVARHALPPEYGLLETTRFAPWTELDSLTVARLLTLGQSFFLDIDSTLTLLAYQAGGQAHGFDGTRLYYEDLFRCEPFDHATSIPPGGALGLGARATHGHPGIPAPDPLLLAGAQRCRDRLRSVPLLAAALDPLRRPGSNQWVVAGRHTSNGRPLLANDPHLDLTAPSTWHPIHLRAAGLDVAGFGLPGVPGVVIGHNRHVAWGLTNNYADLCDTYQEEVRPDPSSPSGLAIVHRGRNEAILPIPEEYRHNVLGDQVPDNLVVVPPGGPIPPFTLVVPRRNQGPVIDLDVANGRALTVQWVGFAATRDLDAVLGWNEADDLRQFEGATAFMDSAAFNVVYADTRGHIAYLNTGELPLREDLQAGSIHGAGPDLIRDGRGGNEWLPLRNRQPGQALDFEILPAAEMPRLVDPEQGFVVNANNDPIGITLEKDPYNQQRAGGGILYLGTYSSGMRAGRITRLLEASLRAGRRLTEADMERIQADTVLPDAAYFVPRLVEALARARAAGAVPELARWRQDAGVVEAVGRLARWDFTTPTGIREGYDHGDHPGRPTDPGAAEVARSVAATLYAVWKGRLAVNTIDAAVLRHGLPLGSGGLRHLFENLAHNGGRGASGLDLLPVPGVADARDRRDILILKSLRDTLDLLAGPRFADAFGGTTDQERYRWGRLHRIHCPHVLGEPFSIPPAGGAFPAPLRDLPGIPVDGGVESVDVTVHPVRADQTADFLQSFAPSQRFVAQARAAGMQARFALPGGSSGVLGDRHYADLLPGWLVNASVALPFTFVEVLLARASLQCFLP